MRYLFFEENNERRVTFAMELTLCTLLTIYIKAISICFSLRKVANLIWTKKSSHSYLNQIKARELIY